MSRQNPLRSIGGEANLARRIERERTARGLSYEALAKQLTAVGCSMSGSAIYKIERAEPPRRITVDELIALAQVFDTTVDDLLIPVEVLEREYAQELLKDLDQADAGMLEAIAPVLQSYSELFYLAAADPELYEYVFGHHYRDDGTPVDAAELPSMFTYTDDLTGGSFGVDESPIRAAYAEFHAQLLKCAGEVARARIAAQQRAERTSS